MEKLDLKDPETNLEEWLLNKLVKQNMCLIGLIVRLHAP